MRWASLLVPARTCCQETSAVGSDTSPARHFGLDIMRDRANLLAGTIEIVRRDGGGTRVALRVPARVGLPPAARAAETGAGARSRETA